MDERYLEKYPGEHEDVLKRTLQNIPLDSFMQSLFDALTLQLVVKSHAANKDEATDNLSHPYVSANHIRTEFIVNLINAINNFIECLLRVSV